MKQEDLGRSIAVFTTKEHGFGTDAILLAHFAAPQKTDVACDLGTGCGIIPLLWCREEKAKHITAVDIQPQAIIQVEKAIEYNRLQNRMQALCHDLKELKGILPFNHYTLVTMNPPYKTMHGGQTSNHTAHAVANFEICCTIEDIAFTGAKLLKPAGRLVLCNRPERLSDTMTAMKNAGIEPKRLKLICHRAGSAPSLFLIEGRKGGNSGLSILPPFYIEGSDGSYTDEMNEIYKIWRESIG